MLSQSTAQTLACGEEAIWMEGFPMRVIDGSGRARFLLLAAFMARAIRGTSYRAQAVAAFWLGMTVAGMPASAQVSADDMARMRQLQSGEFVAKTREGCGVIRKERGPNSKELIVASVSRDSWEGGCVEGMTLGPGKYISRNDKMETVGSTEAWYFYGRALGHAVFTSQAPGIYRDSKSESFSWDGTFYARNVARAEPLEPKENAIDPMVSYFPKDYYQELRYSLLPACGLDRQPCVSEQRPSPTGNYFDGLKHLPCNGSCGSLWVEKAGPLITAFDNYARQHAADVAAVKQALEPTLERVKREADLVQAEKQREAERQRVAAQEAAQKKIDEAARVEQQFRASLQTMNPGQLFARADELNTQGDPTRAREVQRALIGRFPNHQLAATVARQMAGDSGSGTVSPDSRPSPKPSTFTKESSRHSSVCARNIAKVEQVLSAANIERYAGLGTFDFDFYDMVNRVAQRCMANDPLMKTTYESNERNRSQLRSYCQTQSRPCSRWGDSEPEASKNQRWFELFSAEYNKLMADWDGYSRELDGPGGGSSPEGPRSAGGRLSSQQCEAMRRTVDATRVPANASSVTASTETNMFMTKMTLDMIDGRCPGMGVDRISAQQAYKAAEDACNAVQSSGRRCVAQSHYGPAARPQSPVAATGSTPRAAQSGGGEASPAGGSKSSRLPPDNRQCRNCTA
ncbi:MAG TPA: hypothetical protein VM512_08085, partial [Burkholderiaceae bacterium]|nr:hypothetical protein [Burkholderiaceae bacterium]